MKPMIVVTTRLPGDPVEQLRAHDAGREAEIIYLDEPRTATRQELLSAVPGATAILSEIPDRIDEEVLEAATDSLKIVANFGVGYDNIDVDAARERGIMITNTPDVLTESTADVAWLLMLMSARGALTANADIREKRWNGWHPTSYIGADIVDKTLFIVGMGRIGLAVARRAIGWPMKVLYNARHPKPDAEAAPIHAKRVDLDEGLAQADFVSLHCPFTAETKHLINATRLALMKPGSILINTARGPVVDEQALVDALENETIHAAGLDVFEGEPRIHPGLLEHPRATLLPHIGSGSEQSRNRMTRIAVENILAVLSDQTPPNRVV